uniref:NADH dehydrogenase [ubiquinone] 1 alpha subcomplex subunit 3 n=1 Tax=Oryzias melastigma TaxID=30732 RepID=A0A3B3BW15_ORYME
MAGIGAFLKNAWNKEPVIVVSCGIGLIGMILPFISPLTKYTAMLNSAVPYNYPGKYEHCFTKKIKYFCLNMFNSISSFFSFPVSVPVRDDGNMPDVPAHPREAKGPNLDWIKSL